MSLAKRCTYQKLHDILFNKLRKSMKKTLFFISPLIAFSVLLNIFLPSSLFSQDSRLTYVRNVKIGSFMIQVPVSWKDFSVNDMATFRKHYEIQSKEMFREYHGTDSDSSTMVGVAAFHISNNTGWFFIVSINIPPVSNLIALLKSQVKDKMEWGIREGHISRYLDLDSVENEQFSGFIIKTIGKNGAVEVSANLEHKKLKNTLIQPRFRTQKR